MQAIAGRELLSVEGKIHAEAVENDNELKQDLIQAQQFYVNSKKETDLSFNEQLNQLQAQLQNGLAQLNNQKFAYESEKTRAKAALVSEIMVAGQQAEAQRRDYEYQLAGWREQYNMQLAQKLMDRQSSQYSVPEGYQSGNQFVNPFKQQSTGLTLSPAQLASMKKSGKIGQYEDELSGLAL
jgi:hypothetical protein